RAAIGVLFSTSPRSQLVIAWAVGTFTSAAGLILSFLFDWPTGATMVCAFGAALAAAGGLYPFLRGNRERAAARMIRGMRWAAAVILVASAALLVAAPRAPQPLFDLVEYAAPSVRWLYFTRAEEATFTDAL